MSNTMDLIPMMQADGTVVYQPANAQLGELFDFLSKGSGVIATAAGAATSAAGAGLITVGTTAAATIPVVGQIAGAVAIIAGLVARQRAKSKAIKSSLSDVESQRLALQQQNNELDQMIADASMQRNVIVAEIQRLGISGGGLNGLKDWWQKTFAPEKYYGAKIDMTVADIASLESAAQQKIGTLQNIQQQLQDLGDQLTEGQFTNKLGRYLVYGTIGIGTLFALYYLIKYLRS